MAPGFYNNSLQTDETVEFDIVETEHKSGSFFAINVSGPKEKAEDGTWEPTPVIGSEVIFNLKV